MEKEAKYLVTTMKHLPLTQNISTLSIKNITLFLSNIPIYGDLRYQVKQHMYGQRLEYFIRKNLPEPRNSIQSIYWNSLEIAFNKLKMQNKISRMKLVHQLFPTIALLWFIKYEITSTLLRCNKASETYEHIFKCKCDQNIKSKLYSLATLQNKLRKINTKPLIIQAVTALISANQKSSKANFPSTMI